MTAGRRGRARRGALGAAILSLALGASAADAPPASGAGAPASDAAPVAARQALLPAGDPVALVNPGFESNRPGIGNDPEGWYIYQHAGPESYLFALDPEIKRAGSRSLRIDNIGREPYGAIAQVVPIALVRGRTLRFSAWLRTRDAAGKGASLTVVADRAGLIVANDFMARAEVKGTRDWERYAITLAVPANADQLRVGAMLQGKGTVWVDDAVLEILSSR